MKNFTTWILKPGNLIGLFLIYFIGIIAIKSLFPPIYSGLFFISPILIITLYYIFDKIIFYNIRKKFDKGLINANNIEEYLINIDKEKFKVFILEYEKFIIKKKDKIVIYPTDSISNYIKGIGIIEKLELPSFENKKPLLIINTDGIEYYGRLFIKWKNIRYIRNI